MHVLQISMKVIKTHSFNRQDDIFLSRVYSISREGELEFNGNVYEIPLSKQTHKQPY